MRETAGSATAPAARRKNLLRGSFIASYTAGGPLAQSITPFHTPRVAPPLARVLVPQRAADPCSKMVGAEGLGIKLAKRNGLRKAKVAVAQARGHSAPCGSMGRVQLVDKEGCRIARIGEGHAPTAERKWARQGPM